MNRRRLVKRVDRRREPSQRGFCRWCYERTANIKTRWYPYCLNAYHIATGLRPKELRRTL